MLNVTENNLSDSKQIFSTVDFAALADASTLRGVRPPEVGASSTILYSEVKPVTAVNAEFKSGFQFLLSDICRMDSARSR